MLEILCIYLLQFEFGFAVLLLSPVVCSIMAFIRSLREETPITPKPRRVCCSSEVFYMKLCFSLRLNLMASMSISLILFVNIF